MTDWRPLFTVSLPAESDATEIALTLSSPLYGLARVVRSNGQIITEDDPIPGEVRWQAEEYPVYYTVEFKQEHI